jgi:hypothetical protein
MQALNTGAMTTITNQAQDTSYSNVRGGSLVALRHPGLFLWKGGSMEKQVKALVMLPDGSKREIMGKLTTEHAASSYGQPVFIDEAGQV